MSVVKILEEHNNNIRISGLRIYLAPNNKIKIKSNPNNTRNTKVKNKFSKISEWPVDKSKNLSSSKTIG